MGGLVQAKLELKCEVMMLKVMYLKFKKDWLEFDSLFGASKEKRQLIINTITRCELEIDKCDDLIKLRPVP